MVNNSNFFLYIKQKVMEIGKPAIVVSRYGGLVPINFRISFSHRVFKNKNPGITGASFICGEGGKIRAYYNLVISIKIPIFFKCIVIFLSFEFIYKKNIKNIFVFDLTCVKSWFTLFT